MGKIVYYGISTPIDTAAPKQLAAFRIYTVCGDGDIKPDDKAFPHPPDFFGEQTEVWKVNNGDLVRHSADGELAKKSDRADEQLNFLRAASKDLLLEPVPDDNEPRELVVSDTALPDEPKAQKTWSGVLAGLTDYGFPALTALGLGLVSYEDGAQGEIRFILPKPLPDRTWIFPKPQPKLGAGQYELNLSRLAGDSHDISLRFELRAGVNSDPFLKIDKIAKAEAEGLGSPTATDWRASLPHTSGRAFDLFGFLAWQLPKEHMTAEGVKSLRQSLVKVGWARADLGLHKGRDQEALYPISVAEILLGPRTTSDSEKQNLAKYTLPAEARKQLGNYWAECFAAALRTSGNKLYAQAADFIVQDDVFKGDINDAVRTCAAALNDDSVLLQLWFNLWMYVSALNLGSTQPLAENLRKAVGKPTGNMAPDDLSEEAMPIPPEVRKAFTDAIKGTGRSLSELYNNGLTGENWPSVVQELRNAERALEAGSNLKSNGVERPLNFSAYVLAQVVGGYYRALQAPIQIDSASLQEWIEKGFPTMREAEEPGVAPTSVPQPIRFAIPDLDLPGGAVNSGIRGPLVFCRRPGGKTGATWKVINLGELSASYEGAGKKPLLLAKWAPVPIGGAVSEGIALRTGSYLGNPLGVDLIENQYVPPAVTNLKSADPRAVTIWRKQLRPAEDVGPDEQWACVPGLGYSWTYEFIQAPFYRDGSVPLELLDEHKPYAPDTGVPFKEPIQISALIMKFLDGGEGRVRDYVQRRVFFRTTAISPLRLVRGTVKNQGWPVPLKFGEDPANVAPLSRDVVALLVAGNDKDKKDSEQESETRRKARFRRDELSSHSVVILYGDENSPTASLEISVRPPELQFEDWKYWMRRRQGESDWNGFADEVALAQSIVRYMGSNQAIVPDKITQTIQKDIHDYLPKAPDLLDDLAVSGFELEVECIYSADVGYLPEKRLVAPVVTFDDTIPGFPLLRQSRRLAKQAVTVKKIGTGKGGLKGYILEVAPGEVWRVTLSPVVNEENKRHFDPEVAKRLFTLEKPFVAQKSARTFLVEGAHPPELDQLPDARTVWNALELSTKPEGARFEIHINLAKAGAPPAMWMNVHAVRVEWQMWKWNGIPPWASKADLDKLKDHPGQTLFRSPPADVETTQDAREEDWVAAELRAMTMRTVVSPVDKSIAWVPSQAGGIEIPSRFPILNDENDQKWPRFYRSRVRVWSRYAGLPGYENLAVEGLANGKMDKWRRLAAVAWRPNPLQPPLVKMVIPLFEKTQGVAPGFLVLTADTLPSPFHTLTGTIATAQVTRRKDGKYFKALEAGPDAILTTTDGNEDVLPPWGVAEKPPKALLGRAIGLTYERESKDPRFVNAAFLFDQLPPQFRQPADTDWFFKVSFRWEAAVSDTLLNLDAEWDQKWAQREEDRGPETAIWQVRMLAPLDTIDPKDGGKPIDVRTLKFSDTGELLFMAEGKKRILHEPARDDTQALMFLTFAEVQDFFSDRAGTSPRGLYALYPDGPEKIYTWQSVSAEAPGESQKPEKRRGIFIRLLVPRAENAHVSAAKRLRPLLQKTEKQSAIDRFVESLFPGADDLGETRIKDVDDKATSDKDAKAMIFRISQPIAAVE